MTAEIGLILKSIGVFGGLLAGLAVFLLIAERYLVNYGTCEITINAGQRVLQVEGGQTLLYALYGEKVFIASACGGRGTCGYCKVVVKAGGGQVLPTETPYLTRREIRSGVRLACQVKVRQDLQVKIAEDLLNAKMFAAVVRNTRSLTHDIKEIRLALIDPAEISHRPGQYIQVEAPSPDGPVFRAYSISSPIYEPGEVELNVRLVPGGIGSTWLHGLKPGNAVSFTGPYGEFRLNDDPAVEIVCVAGGCGMAPVKNIIHSLYRRWPDRTCWLFFGCRTARDAFYLDDYTELAKKHPSFHVVYALSDPPTPDEAWDGERGFIHLSVGKYLADNVKRQAFLCGPPPMIDAVTRVLQQKGLKPKDVFYDKF
ncbi:MAG TPA: 2Fe-2S iron-sulfur cluster binding domain-containing protein [Planctomycetota bacterium]|nr:2Fe-2S iron-sulfur cluster binding domain-containing protein [Planctomycetota bacterium]